MTGHPLRPGTRTGRHAAPRRTGRRGNTGWGTRAAGWHPGGIADRCAAGTAAAAGGLTFTAAFDPGARAAVLVLIAAVTGALALPPRSWPRWLAVPLMTVAATLPAGVVGRWHGAGWAVLGRALLGGPGEALRLTLPLPPGLLTVPVLLTGIAAVTGALIARMRPAHLAALLPAAAVAGAGTVVAGPGAHQHVPVALGFGAVALLVLRGAGPPRGTHVAGRSYPTVAGLVVVAVAAAPLLWLPGPVPGHAVNLRDRFVAPERAIAGFDLIDRLAGWRAEPSRELFTVQRGPVTESWRLAVLDRYDGDSWDSGARFIPAGLGVPPRTGPVPGGAVHAVVRVGGLDVPYLPALDRPVRVAPPVDAVDPADGVLIAAGPLPPGTTYRVVSVPRATPTVPGDTAAAGTDTELTVPGDLEPGLRAMLTGADTAAEVTRALRAGRRNIAGAPVSAGVPALRTLLAAGGTGSDVQFATAFALAMRLLGVPARLVVGFQPVDAGGIVRAGDARVWVELRYARAGWVRHDPAPPPVRADQSPPPPAGGDVLPGPVPTRPPPPPPPPGPAPLPWALLLLAVAVTVTAAVLSRRVLRRAWRRRPAGDPAARVVRAWLDTRDTVAVTSALPRPVPALTPADVQTVITATLGAGAPGAGLARLADRALYAPRDVTPGDRAGGAPPAITAGDVRAAWAEAGRVRAALRRH